MAYLIEQARQRSLHVLASAAERTTLRTYSAGHDFLQLLLDRYGRLLVHILQRGHPQAHERENPPPWQALRGGGFWRIYHDRFGGLGAPWSN